MTQTPQTEQGALLDTAITLPTPERRRVPITDIAEPNDTGASNTTVGSMETVGQLEPVRLMQQSGRNALLLIVDGNRRIINAARLGWTAVDALVYPALGGEQLAHLQLGIHNRAPNPVAEARSLALLIRSGVGSDDETLARAAKKSVTQVRKLKRLLSLPEDVLELVGSVLAEGTAEAVANLSPEHRAAAILRIRERAAQEKGRFTNQDLKEVQQARDSQAAALLAGLPVTMPVIRLTPLDLLTAQVRAMCQDAQVSVAELISALGREEAPVPLAVQAAPVPAAWEEQPTPAAWEEPAAVPATAAPTPTAAPKPLEALRLEDFFPPTPAQQEGEALAARLFGQAGRPAPSRTSSPAPAPWEQEDAPAPSHAAAPWEQEQKQEPLTPVPAAWEEAAWEETLPQEDAAVTAAQDAAQEVLRERDVPDPAPAPVIPAPAPVIPAPAPVTPTPVAPAPAPAAPAARPTPGQGSFGPRTFGRSSFTGRRA